MLCRDHMVGDGRWGGEFCSGKACIQKCLRRRWGRGGKGGGRGGVSPGTCASASSGCPGRWWPRGPPSPCGSAPTGPAWAPAGPTQSSAAPPSVAAAGSPRSASAWPDAYCCPTPLEEVGEGRGGGGGGVREPGGGAGEERGVAGGGERAAGGNRQQIVSSMKV